MRRFRWVFLTLILSCMGIGYFIFSQYRLREMFSQTRERLMAIASNAALVINTQELLQVPLERTGDNSLAYRVISDQLVTIKQANPSVKYAYIMMTTDQSGILQYVVDADPAPKVITAKSLSAFPGDKYDARAQPEMLKAYSGTAVDKKITTDAWGVAISGYAPIRDANGKSVAILGVDIDATQIRALQKNVRLSCLLALGVFLAFLLSLSGILISRFKNKDSSRLISISG